MVRLNFLRNNSQLLGFVALCQLGNQLESLLRAKKFLSMVSIYGTLIGTPWRRKVSTFRTHLTPSRHTDCTFMKLWLKIGGLFSQLANYRQMFTVSMFPPNNQQSLFTGWSKLFAFYTSALHHPSRNSRLLFPSIICTNSAISKTRSVNSAAVPVDSPVPSAHGAGRSGTRSSDQSARFCCCNTFRQSDPWCRPGRRT
jgi:hypothetical protein